MILGQSGTGKSTSIRNLNPDETLLINVQSKALPFKGGKVKFSKEAKNLLQSDNPQTIIGLLAKVKDNPQIKIVVIDDSQYIMANQFMRASEEKGFDKFNKIGRYYWDILNACNQLPDDVIVFVMSHIDHDDSGREKAKTIGKMLDDKICLEGMFTMVLKTKVKDGQYLFCTQNNGNDTVKSPMEMFEQTEIENDLSIVVDAIRNY